MVCIPSTRIESLTNLPDYALTLCDVTPRQLVQLAGNRLSDSYRHKLERYRYGPGVFKVDYALREPIPWTAADCRHAATVHFGGSVDEIAASEAAMSAREHAERPFVLLSQPTLLIRRVPLRPAHRLGLLSRAKWIHVRHAGSSGRPD